MKVIAINEKEKDVSVAVVKMPEGETADSTFVAWFRSEYNAKKMTDSQILEEPYVWSELEVIKV